MVKALLEFPKLKRFDWLSSSASAKLHSRTVGGTLTLLKMKFDRIQPVADSNSPFPDI
jgi:hypothetical protein